MFTNAPSYKDLEGWGGIVGGSLACKFFDFGYGQLFMSGYTGLSLGGNLGIYPFKIQMHGEEGYTVTVGKVNIYQLLENLEM